MIRPRPPSGASEGLALQRRVKRVFGTSEANQSPILSHWFDLLARHLKWLPRRVFILAKCNRTTRGSVLMLQFFDALAGDRICDAEKAASSMEELGGLAAVLSSIADAYDDGVLNQARHDYVTELTQHEFVSVPISWTGPSRQLRGAFGKSFIREAGVFTIEIFANHPVYHGMAKFLEKSEGAPGWAHGGVIASVADVFLSWVSELIARAGTTVELTIRYKSPVPLLTTVFLELQASENDNSVLNGLARDECSVVLFSFSGKFFKIRESKL